MDADLLPTHSSYEGKLQCGGSIRTLETQTMTHCLARPDMATIQSFISVGARGCAGYGRWVAELIGAIHRIQMCTRY